MYIRPFQNIYMLLTHSALYSLVKIPLVAAWTARFEHVYLCHEVFKDFGSGAPFLKFQVKKPGRRFALYLPNH